MLSAGAKRWKHQWIIEQLMQEKGLNRAEATKLWYESKTKQITIDSDDLDYLSAPRCYEELLMELKNDPMWMQHSLL